MSRHTWTGTRTQAEAMARIRRAAGASDDGWALIVLTCGDEIARQLECKMLVEIDEHGSKVRPL